ncbi:hypothetical protein PRIPAC_90299 [Pristionchus pacificus]|uniref:Uncharacterized protein n=1 Tax=Pristionchus pacificus TaxID=54126 RepID=A0A2A6CXA2_PRIPA|nr:hypothetical protein PRIPAC_90299 [Pristionchus pacificus]|eukprot:PDM82716.1 hypothetical protein PRIPAC_37109 [Pristionchus pacificus]
MSTPRRSSNDSNQSQDPQPESPLSDRSPRLRDPVIKKKRSSSLLADRLSPKTPVPAPDSSERPKHPRRYSNEGLTKVTDFRLPEVHRPGDRVVHVDIEEIEHEAPRGGTPSSSPLSLPPGAHSLLDDSVASSGPRTSTPKKSFRKTRKPESLYKKVLMKSASRPTVRPDVNDSSMMDGYRTAQESMANSTAGLVMSPIRIETGSSYRNPADTYRIFPNDSYRSANSTQRALFSQQGAAPLPRARSSSMSRHAAPSSPATLCQLVTPLVVHTAHEVNAVSVTGQVLIISQTLVRSAHSSADVRKLMNHLAGKQPLISNEMSQVDIDHDNEHSKHEVFVGSNAILIQRISTIHRGRDRNSFETDDRRTYRFICQGDLLPEDRRDKQTKPRHLTIIAESSTVKDCEEIEKSERVVLVFDASDAPARVLAPLPPEISLTSANDLTARPSALRDSPVSFEEHVRVSDHSHINIVRKARVHANARLWDEPLTELKEQRVYKQQLADDANCEPVRITRSHSMTRGAPGGGARDRSPSASRRPHTPSRIERGRTPGRSSRNSTVLRPLMMSPLNSEPSRRRDQSHSTPRASRPTDLLTCISPESTIPRRFLDVDDTVQDSVSLPSRTSPDPKTLQQRTVRFSQTPRTPDCATAVSGPYHTSRSASCSPFKRPAPATPYKRGPVTPDEHNQSMRTPPPSSQQHLTPLRTAQQMRTPPPQSQQHLTPLRTAQQMRTPTSVQQQFTPLRTAQQTRTPPPPTREQLTPLRTAQQQTPRSTPRTPTRPASVVDEDTSAGSSQSPTQNRTPTTVSPRRARLTTAFRPRTPSRSANMDEWERMLDTTQPVSPVAAAIARRIPDDFMPAAAGPLLSDTRLGRARPPTRSLHQPLRQRPMSAQSRPLGSAKRCSALDSPRPAAGSMLPVQKQLLQQRRPQHPLRRAVSLHSELPAQHLQQQSPAGAPRAPAAPANSAIAIASPFRGQQYVPQQLQQQPAAAPQPRLPRTTAPALRPADPVAVSASASATRVARPAPSKPVVVGGGKPVRAGQKNVELVDNPDDYDEVVFALKADRADMIRFAPKRVRIDDQTLWEETENWSQTSLTPVTGPRTVARSSSSYDQVQPVAAGALPQPPPPAAPSAGNAGPSVHLQQSSIRVAPPRSAKTIVTASTASSASSASNLQESDEQEIGQQQERREEAQQHALHLERVPPRQPPSPSLPGLP